MRPVCESRHTPRGSCGEMPKIALETASSKGGRISTTSPTRTTVWLGLYSKTLLLGSICCWALCRLPDGAALPRSGALGNARGDTRPCLAAPAGTPPPTKPASGEKPGVECAALGCGQCPPSCTFTGCIADSPWRGPPSPPTSLGNGAYAKWSPPAGSRRMAAVPACAAAPGRPAWRYAPGSAASEEGNPCGPAPTAFWLSSPPGRRSSASASGAGAPCFRARRFDRWAIFHSARRRCSLDSCRRWQKLQSLPWRQPRAAKQ
mmetsp:Transcript_32464/g.87090  ORF Transcript_32464/g.87090 Transcript_32464/m.87090 type:complete len:262 (+) Transcript_32464:80-865(+)